MINNLALSAIWCVACCLFMQVNVDPHGYLVIPYHVWYRAGIMCNWQFKPMLCVFWFTWLLVSILSPCSFCCPGWYAIYRPSSNVNRWELISVSIWTINSLQIDKYLRNRMSLKVGKYRRQWLHKACLADEILSCDNVPLSNMNADITHSNHPFLRATKSSLLSTWCFTWRLRVVMWMI